MATFQAWRRDRDLREHGREAPATVVEVSGSGKGRKVFVEFEAGGQVVRSKVEGRMKVHGQALLALRHPPVGDFSVCARVKHV